MPSKRREPKPLTGEYVGGKNILVPAAAAEVNVAELRGQLGTEKNDKKIRKPKPKGR